MKSKKALFEFLNTHFNRTDLSLTSPNISDETYGKKSCIYLWDIKGMYNMERGEFERLLQDNGFVVNPKYGKGLAKYGMQDYDATEIQVSYFKGYHWDE